MSTFLRVYILCDRTHYLQFVPILSNCGQIWEQLCQKLVNCLIPWILGAVSASINRDFRNTFIFPCFPGLYLNCLIKFFPQMYLNCFLDQIFFFLFLCTIRGSGNSAALRGYFKVCWRSRLDKAELTWYLLSPSLRYEDKARRLTSALVLHISVDTADNNTNNQASH